MFFLTIKVDFYDSLPIKKSLTLHNVIINIKSFLSKDKNHYYHKIFLEKHLIRYLDKDIRPLDLTISKMSGYVKAFKVEDKIDKLMPFRIVDEKLLEKYKAIWTRRFKKI